MQLRVVHTSVAILILLALAIRPAAAGQLEVPALPDLKGAKVALMPIDVELFELTAADLEQPRADWTQAARSYVKNSIAAENNERGTSLSEFSLDSVPFETRQVLVQYEKLHRQVGLSMLAHERAPGLSLPDKSSVNQWTLDTGVSLIQGATGAGYAVYLYIKDSYSTARRVALNIVMAILGGPVKGGTQIGYASLVDLRTGDVVWFDSIASGFGDLRTQEAANSVVGKTVPRFRRHRIMHGSFHRRRVPGGLCGCASTALLAGCETAGTAGETGANRVTSPPLQHPRAVYRRLWKRRKMTSNTRPTASLIPSSTVISPT